MPRKPKQAADSPPDEPKKPNRSPAWEIYARIDEELKPVFEQYRNLQEYPPNLARVIEKALKMLFEKAKLWPPKDPD